MKVDFHCHSTASDGTLSPTEVVSRARGTGIAALALTDHDNCDGVGELLAAGGAGFFAGVELSIEPGAGFDKFHLLGLGVDPANAELKALLRRILDGRNERNRRILANFARIGIEIAEDDIAAYAHGEVLARPHFARWLMDHGYVQSVAEGFERYLLPDSPAETRCYEERWHPRQEDAFAAIHAAGGVTVMAHPRFWRRGWRHEGSDFAAAAAELRRLKDAGLDGLECLYSSNSPAENVGFTRIASELGLLKSAGSDFHGANKPEIALGMEVDDAFIRPLLSRLGV